MKTTLVGLMAASALVVSGCSGLNDSGYAQTAEPVDSDNYVGVCLDANENRVDDSYCPVNDGGSDMSNFFWGYFLATALLPSHGSHSTGHQRYNKVSGYNTYRGGVPAAGGKINYATYKPKTSTIKTKTSSISAKLKSGWGTKKVQDTKPQDTKKKSGWGSSNKSKTGGSSGGGKRR